MQLLTHTLDRQMSNWPAPKCDNLIHAEFQGTKYEYIVIYEP